MNESDSAFDRDEQWLDSILDVFPEIHPDLWYPKDEIVSDTNRPFSERWIRIIRLAIDAGVIGKKS
jgi:hypothetical protein